ncbi:MAG: DeoR/GlpR family DNA-binding transcription regulator [Paenibacillaceae bacterium]
MLSINRHEKIVEWLGQNRSVKVSDLSKQLNVTEKTIREDLEKLENMGLLKRIHGGAVLSGDGNSALLPISSNDTRNGLWKKEIARSAIQYIEQRDIIALDGGSTTLEIARLLENMPLTVITNDLFIISELVKKENIQLVVPGGYRNRNYLISTEAISFMEKLNIKKVFLSATAVDLEYGLSVFTSAQIEQKQAMIRCAAEVYAVVDHSKFDKCALMTIAPLSVLKLIITDDGLNSDVIRKYEAHGIHIVID